MSTRSAITRPTEDGFLGVYHHWDGYPAGLGRTLFRLFRDQTLGSVAYTLEILIDKHPAGWSTINDADWGYQGHRDEEQAICRECGEPAWKHYRQNYKSRGLPEPESSDIEGKPACCLGHSPDVDRDGPRPPEAYNDGDNPITQANAAEGGCEWVYVIDEKAGTMQILSSYVADGSKMIGMFGMGDPNASWADVALVYLDGMEPDWEEIQKKAYGEVVA